MKIINLLLILIIFSMSGCVKKEYIYKDKIVYFKPPIVLLTNDNKIPVFKVSKKDYVLAEPIQRENYLTNYINELLTTLGIHRLKNEKLNQWYKDVNSTVAE